jgi:hypothetical protein
MAEPEPPRADRRQRDGGPPAGTPDRRRITPAFENKLTTGNLLQSASIILSALGVAIASIFAAGGYVQHLRDDLTSAENRAAAQENTQDQKIIDILQRLADRNPK